MVDFSGAFGVVRGLGVGEEGFLAANVVQSVFDLSGS